MNVASHAMLLSKKKVCESWKEYVVMAQDVDTQGITTAMSLDHFCLASYKQVPSVLKIYELIINFVVAILSMNFSKTAMKTKP